MTTGKLMEVYETYFKFKKHAIGMAYEHSKEHTTSKLLGFSVLLEMMVSLIIISCHAMKEAFVIRYGELWGMHSASLLNMLLY